MHICFATFNYLSNKGASGVGIYTYVMAQALKEMGHEVSVVAVQARKEEYYVLKEGVNLHTVSIGNIHWYISKIPLLGRVFALPIRELESSYAMWAKVKKIHKTKRIDLLEGTESGLFFSLLFKHPYPVVIKLHGERYTVDRYTPRLKLEVAVKLSRIIQRFAIRRVNLLIAPSRTHCNEIMRELVFLKSPIHVVENCIDSFLYQQAQKQYANEGNGQNIKNVLFVGRLEPNKGIVPFLQCIAKVVKTIPDVHFVIVGGYHPRLKRKKLEDIIFGKGIAEYVNMMGAVSRQELANLYRQATLCVVPSYYEAFGIVYLEAMAFKKPVIAFRIGSAQEIIEDGVSGILVEPGNKQALADAIITLLKDPVKSKAIGEAGYRISQQERFSRANMVNKTVKIYKQLLQ